MKFSEYLASFITPQMTLLEKFNAMCKYLKENDTTPLYKHTINFSDSVVISFINTENKEYTINELNTTSILYNSLELKYRTGKVLNITGYGSFVVLSYYYPSSISTYSLNGKTISSQSVEPYEN